MGTTPSPQFGVGLPSRRTGRIRDRDSRELEPIAMTSLTPNQQLKELRSRLGMSTREVAELSQKIADAEGNPEFHISNPWLTQIENSDSIPGIHKLYSLSAIYRIKITALLLLFGIDLTKLHQHQLVSPLRHTHLTTLEVADPEKTVPFPVRFEPSFDVRHTNLLSRMVEVWGQVPIALIQGLDVRNCLYGYIGLDDYTLFPILRPGSFVQIDPRVRKILPGIWRTEYERPIYFVELRDGYCCCWCELADKDLLLIPHPLSPCHVRRLTVGLDAEIVGQVTGAGIRLTGAEVAPANPVLRLPKKP
jgi:transcriptional regulator with XRE-family HTH domain